MLAPSLPTFGPWRLRQVAWAGLGLVVDGLAHIDGQVAPAAYVDDVLLTDPHREAFLALIDAHGLVVCRGAVPTARATHRDVRGRSSRGRLSPGEYFHHDGCAGPTKPRVVEIACPVQDVPRHTATAIAPFVDVLGAMLRCLPPALRAGELGEFVARANAGEPVVAEPEGDAADHVQGLLNRALRRGLSAEDNRAYFRDVDTSCGAFREPWTMGESRFIANAPLAGPSMQHRRAYLKVHAGGEANGKLIKRWPAEELTGQIVCDRGD